MNPIALVAVIALLGSIVLGFTRLRNRRASQSIPATVPTTIPSATRSPTLSAVTTDEKTLIDSWLEQNNLNQYGDSKDTMYAGGTPLFDERTGERTDRYDYLVKKYPERPWNQ